MTLESFKEAVAENWHLVAGAVDAYLNEILIHTAASSELGDNANAEMGAQKALARIIKDFRSAGKKPAGGEIRLPITRPLNRHQTEAPKTEKTTP